jgi:hypothetical protein
MGLTSLSTGLQWHYHISIDGSLIRVPNVLPQKKHQISKLKNQDQLLLLGCTSYDQYLPYVVVVVDDDDDYYYYYYYYYYVNYDNNNYDYEHRFYFWRFHFQKF